MKVLFLKGLPGSGKSTWAKDFCEKNKDWVRVNRDDLRNMRGTYWLPKQEDLITRWEKEFIFTALWDQKNVIVDATNLNPTHVNGIKEDINFFHPDTETEIKEFNTTPEECIKRDLKRANSVGADVIWRMYYKYIKPKQVYHEPLPLPHCIIVDIDGTLADNSGRGPFDWEKVGQDKVNDHVRLICNNYYATGKTVIIFSGRDSVCAEDTADWLTFHGINFHKLYMRPKGNNERDTIIKERMFYDHVSGQYYVDFVLDDRMSVIRMWDGLGLKVISNNPLAIEF